MRLKKIIGLAILGFICTNTFAQERITPEQYIEQYKEIAIREMKRMGVPAAITLAQGILESESGNSVLVKKSNNHFGIKCRGSWIAGGVKHDDDEKGECFRQYKTADESYRDHSNFLRNSERYSSLFKLKADDYKGWATGLKKAGYATNPQYPNLLIKNIEQYNLNQYTLLAISEVPVFEKEKYEDDKEPPKLDVVEISEEKIEVQKVEEVLKPSEPELVYGRIIEENGRKKVLVKQGTSLLAIATDHNIDLKKLMEYNNLKQDGIMQIDNWLFLDKEKKNLKKTTTSLTDYHTVAAGEGLYSIAKKYKVTVAQLKEWNKLENDNLSLGQKLIVNKQ